MSDLERLRRALLEHHGIDIARDLFTSAEYLALRKKLEKE